MGKKINLSAEDFETRLSTRHQAGVPRIGFDERVHRWSHIRGLIVQSLIADPDILLYFKCSSSRVFTSELSQFHGLLCAAIEGIQELVDTVPSAQTPPSADTAQALITRALSGESIQVETLQKEVARVVRGEATSGIRNKRRVSTTDASQIEAVLREARRRSSLLSRHAASILSAEVLTQGLTQVAEIPVLQKLSQTLNQAPSFDRALDAAKSVGTLAFCRRKVSLRNKVDQTTATPVMFTAVMSASTVTLNHSPALLGIEIGDTISVLASTATVTAISGNQVTTSSPLPQGEIKIERPGYGQFQPVKTLLTRFLQINKQALSRPLDLSNRPSAALFCSGIAELAGSISVLTQDARVGASRLGIEAPEGTLLNDLYSAQFNFSAETVESARRALIMLREEGFRNAASTLSRGDYGILQATDPRIASSEAGSIRDGYGGFVERLRETL